MSNARSRRRQGAEVAEVKVGKWIAGPALWAGLGVFVIAIIAFLPVLTLDYTNWDDADYVTKCPYIKYLTWENIRFFLTTSYFSNYHPLTSISYMIEYSLWRLNPVGYHSTNLLLHAVNAVWVYLLGRKLLKGRWDWAAAAAVLYAVHPLRVEVVAWVAARKDLLCAAFALPALLYYIDYLEKSGRSRYWKCFALFCAALLSKPMAVTIPVVLLGLDWLYERRISWLLVREKLPFFVASGIMSLITVVAQGQAGSIRVDMALEWIMKLQTATYGFSFYLGKTLWPTHLSPLYPYGMFRETILPPAAYFAPYLFVALVAIAIYAAQRSRVWGFGILMYVVMLLPVIQLVPIGGAYASDRYTYLPIIGLTIASVGAIGHWIDCYPRYRRLMLGAGSIIAVLLMALSWKYALVWKNGITLWRYAIGVTPISHVAYNNLGSELLERGQDQEAFMHYCRAIGQNPRYAHAYNNRGNYYTNKGDFKRAVEDYQMAISIEPRHAPPYNNLGTVLVRLGKIDEAMAIYTKSIQLNPFYSEAYLNRATLYATKGETEKALSDMLTAVEINPNLPVAYNDLGNAMGNLGRFEEAEKMFFLALRYDPGNPLYIMNRGTHRKARGDMDAAIADFRDAYARGLRTEMLFVNWGGAVAEKGNQDEAIKLYTAALDVNTSSPAAYCNRGASYIKLGKLEAAEKDISMAIQLKPDFAMAYKHRGVLKSTRQQNAAAIEDFTKSLSLLPTFSDALINRAVNYYILKDYNAAWADVRKLRQMQSVVAPSFIKELQEASGIKE